MTKPAAAPTLRATPASNATATISTHFLRPLERALAGTSTPFFNLLSACGVLATKEGAPVDRIPASVARRVWWGAALISGDPTIGIRAAEMVDVGTFGVLDYLAQCSLTVGAALQNFVRKARIIQEGVTVTLRIGHEEGLLQHLVVDEDAEMTPFEEDFVVASYLVGLRRLAGEDWIPTRVAFRHGSPADSTRYRRLLGVTPTYLAEVTTLGIPNRVLALRSARADAAVRVVLEAHVERLAEDLSRTDSIVDLVRREIVAQIRVGNLKASAVATALSISSRTMHRKLREHDSTFRQIVNITRRDLAQRLLVEEDFTARELAELLDYSEPSASIRAFRQWTGCNARSLSATQPRFALRVRRSGNVGRAHEPKGRGVAALVRGLQDGEHAPAGAPIHSVEVPALSPRETGLTDWDEGLR